MMTFLKAAFVMAAILFPSGAGCQTVQPKVVERVVQWRVEIPPSLLECMPEPQAREFGATRAMSPSSWSGWRWPARTAVPGWPRSRGCCRISPAGLLLADHPGEFSEAIVGQVTD